jgi:hypothetical protein
MKGSPRSSSNAGNRQGYGEKADTMGKEIPKSERSPKFGSEIPPESKPEPREGDGTPLADKESSPSPCLQLRNAEGGVQSKCSPTRGIG